MPYPRKRKLLGAVIVVSVVLMTICAAVGLSSSVAASKTQTLTVEQSQTAPLYLLKVDEGELCVLQEGTVVRRTGVFVAALPEEDRVLLEAGIAVHSEQDLASLMEDLCS